MLRPLWDRVTSEVRGGRVAAARGYDLTPTFRLYRRSADWRREMRMLQAQLDADVHSRFDFFEAERIPAALHLPFASHSPPPTWVVSHVCRHRPRSSEEMQLSRTNPAELYQPDHLRPTAALWTTASPGRTTMQVVQTMWMHADGDVSVLPRRLSGRRVAAARSWL